MTGEPLVGWRIAARRCFGWGATVLAAIAVVATSPASEFEEVHLPDRAVILDASTPELVQSFQVTSNDGRFDLLLAFTTEQAASPTLRLRALGDVDLQVDEAKSLDSTTGVERRYLLTPLCPKEFPCVLDFEVTVSASLVGYDAVNGILGIGARYSFPGDIYDRYLAIDPL